MEIAVSFLVAIFGALAGAVVQRVFSRRQQRYRATLDLFKQYNSHEMLEARAAAWEFLRRDYPETGAPISAFYADSRNSALSGRHAEIVKVVYFWYLLYVMRREKELLDSLTREMFSLQYAQWESVLLPLAKNTKAYDADAPEWSDMLLRNKMAWLKKGRT